MADEGDGTWWRRANVDPNDTTALYISAIYVSSKLGFCGCRSLQQGCTQSTDSHTRVQWRLSLRTQP